MIFRDTRYLFKQTRLYFLQYQKMLATALATAQQDNVGQYLYWMFLNFPPLSLQLGLFTFVIKSNIYLAYFSSLKYSNFLVQEAIY